MEGRAEVTASLPFFQGSLGLTSATRIREGAHWASWADCLKMVRQRHPAVTDTMISGLAEGPARCFEAVRRCAHSLTDAGFESPSWTELASSQEVVCAPPSLLCKHCNKKQKKNHMCLLTLTSTKQREAQSSSSTWRNWQGSW